MYLRDGSVKGPASPTATPAPCPGPAGPQAAPLEVGDVLIVGLAADVDDLGEQLVTVGRALGLVHVGHQLLDNLHQVLLGHLGAATVREGAGWQGGSVGGRAGTHHSVQEIEGPQADGLILVVQALQHEILVCLHRLGVRPQDLGHGQEPQVLHCRDSGQLSHLHEVQGRGQAATTPQPPGHCWPHLPGTRLPSLPTSSTPNTRLSMPGAANWATGQVQPQPVSTAASLARDMLPTLARQLLCYPGRDHTACRVDLSYSLALPRKNLVTSAQNQQIWSAIRSACLVNLQGDCRPMARSANARPAPTGPWCTLDVSPVLP